MLDETNSSFHSKEEEEEKKKYLAVVVEFACEGRKKERREIFDKKIRIKRRTNFHFLTNFGSCISEMKTDSHEYECGYHGYIVALHYAVCGCFIRRFFFI